MSLRIWLPLNGDLHNQGISGDNFIINTNPIYINNGKIGKAMSTGQITMPAAMTASILNNNAFSFACWIYVNAATGDTNNRAMLFGNGDMTPPNNRKFSIFQYPTCNDLHLSWQNDASGTFCGGVWAGYFSSYEWTHVAITYQNPVGTIYINGIKKANFNGTSNSASFEYDTCLFANISNESRYLNDYRIYDHCLSAKEVKEISQGLVLHYKLNELISSVNNNLLLAIDSSGYNHNGTALNTITTSSDTPRYNLSTNLINADSAINCGRSGMVTDSITVNFWCKQSSWGNPVSCTEGGGWNMENNGGSLTFPVYIAGIGYVHSKNGSTANQIAPATLNNNWHMLTGVYDRIGQKVQLYIDGELEQENTVSSPNLISYHSGNVIWIGAEASGSATAPASNGMIGLFSDFRIYCTALSAEDIKELYQVSASIDKLGNIHTYDFNENDLNNISDTGILHSSQINESNFSKYLKYDPNVYIEPDGSCWLHIYHHNNPSLGSFASTNDFEHGIYIDDNRWFNVNVCNYLNKWELMVKGKFTSTSNEWKIRWIQSVNPMVATFAQVAVANITKITTNGYLSSPNNWGGLYAKKGSTYLSANNGTNGNWWGAVGSYSVYQGGIPGWGYQGNTPVTTTGFNDLYVRIDNVDFDNINNVSNNKNKIWTANQFIEK